MSGCFGVVVGGDGGPRGSPDPPAAPSAFVVEQQPSMPNACKRPLVLRTTSKFSARARLLVRLHDRNHGMEASIHIDRSGPPRG